MRSIICVVAGFVVVMAVVIGGTAAATELIVEGGLQGAATGSPSDLPATYFAAGLMILAMGAVLGGWVTARMAPEREMMHVFALAALIILMSVPGILGYGPSAAAQPAWFVYAMPVFGVAGAVLGGRLRSRVVVTES